MSTCSYVGILNADGSVEMIYVHSDGYPTGNGKILRDYYNTEDRVRAMIALGDASEISSYLSKADIENHNSTSFPRACVFYHRDRGDEWRECKACYAENVEKAFKEACANLMDWFYIFTPDGSGGGTWEVRKTTVDSSFSLLDDAIAFEEKQRVSLEITGD